MKTLRIGFFAKNCVPFHQTSLEERPLGGTETGVIRLSQELTKNGHLVEVFTNYEHSSDAKSESNPRYFKCQEIHLAKVFYLTGDGPEQYINFGLGDLRVSSKIDALLCVSSWQADVLCQESGFPRSKTHFIGNGVHLDYFKEPGKKDIYRLYYASSPNRGLLFAYQAFCMLQKIIPNITFEVFSGFDVYNTKEVFSGPLVARFNQLKKLMSSNSAISIHGNLKQADLAKEISKCSLLFYPNQFVETSCIVALEAQKARSYAFRHFGWDKVAKRFLEVYERTSSN